MSGKICREIEVRENEEANNGRVYRSYYDAHVHKLISHSPPIHVVIVVVAVASAGGAFPSSIFIATSSDQAVFSSLNFLFT